MREGQITSEGQPKPNSEAAFLKILGVSEMPTRVEEFPESFTIPPEYLVGLAKHTKDTIVDKCERGGFVTISGKESSDEDYKGTQKQVDGQLAKDAKERAETSDPPLFFYHTDSSVLQSANTSLFSINDVLAFACSPQIGKIFAVSGQEGVEVLVQLDRTSNNRFAKGLRYYQVKKTLKHNDIKHFEDRDITRIEQSAILKGLGIQLYYARGRVSGENPPLAGITVSKPQPPQF